MKKSAKIVIPIISIICLLIAIVFIVIGEKTLSERVMNGESPYKIAVDEGYNGSNEEFISSLVGETINNEKTSYELATEKGFKGTASEWLQLLIGPHGANGQTAYEIAVEKGYKGTEQEWSDTLISNNEKSKKTALEILNENGFALTPDEYQQYIKEIKDGTYKRNKTAFDFAKELGFQGSNSDWLNAIIQTENATDESVYKLAVNYGYKGNRADWLSTLAEKNAVYVKNGTCAYELATWNGFNGSLSTWLKSISSNCESQVFEVVNQNGYKGTFYDWLQFFVYGNEQNSSPYNMLKKLGYNDSLQDLLVVLSNEEIEGVLDFMDTKGCEISKKELIAILIGSSEDYGYAFAKEHGFKGNEKEWIAAINSGKKVKDTDIKKVYINKEKHLIFVFDNNEEKDFGLVDVSNSADLKVVNFTDNDGKVIKTEIVKIGDTIATPEAPQEEGYVFIGWDKKTNDIKTDITVRPQYEKITSPTISVESITVEPGEKNVLISVNITNNPGILGMTLNCIYDQNIINVSNAENGDALKSVLSFTKPLHFDTKSRYSWDGQEISTEQVKDGEILKMYISVPENAVPGVYPITFSSTKGDIIDNDLSSIDVKFVSGTVTVK